jgi:DNA-binding transcriptional LysR family regulator
VTLTPAGQQLLTDAREVLRLTELAQRNVEAAKSGDIGRISVGFTMSAAYNIVPTLTRLYKSAFPNVDFRVREIMPIVLDRALREGDIDVGISFPGLAGPQITSRQLFREPMNVVLPVGHPLARARRLRVRDLWADTFIVVPREQAAVLYDGVVQRCQSAGFTPIIGLEVYLQQTIVTFVAEGLGVAFVPSSMQKARVSGTVFKSIKDPPMVEQHVVWQFLNTNPCIRGFLGVCSTLPTQA